jgi:hypothetical protein
MRREAFTIAAIALVCVMAVVAPPPVTFESSCECRDAHGKARLAVKATGQLQHVIDDSCTTLI